MKNVLKESLRTRTRINIPDFNRIMSFSVINRSSTHWANQIKGFQLGLQVALPKVPDTGRASICAQNIELFTHVLSGNNINFIPDKESKYRTVRLNTGHLATIISAHN